MAFAEKAGFYERFGNWKRLKSDQGDQIGDQTARQLQGQGSMRRLLLDSSHMEECLNFAEVPALYRRKKRR